MQSPRFEGGAQWFAWAEQVLLADDLVESARTQTLCQRSVGTRPGRGVFER